MFSSYYLNYLLSQINKVIHVSNVIMLVMDNYEQQKIVEVVLYILNKTGGIDFYHLFKILYFAERDHLAKWGDKIISDDFYALKYGPVPTRLYDAVKHQNTSDSKLSDRLWQVAEFAGDDAPNVLLPKRKADTDYISLSEISALDNSINKYSTKLFEELKRISHDEVWEKAFKDGHNIISPLDMAKASGATDATINYIKEQISIDKALS